MAFGNGWSEKIPSVAIPAADISFCLPVMPGPVSVFIATGKE